MFIKLTETGSDHPMYVNSDRVAFLEDRPEEGVVVRIDDHAVAVEEKLADILKMLEGAARCAE